MGESQQNLEKSGTSSLVTATSSLPSQLSTPPSSQLSTLGSGRVDAADLPEQLVYLASDAANPQLYTDPDAQRTGRVRTWKMSRGKRKASTTLKRLATARIRASETLAAAQNAAAKTSAGRPNVRELQDGRFFRTRRMFGRLVLSWPVQAFVMLTIIFDCVVTVVGLTKDDGDDDPTFYVVNALADILIPTVFSVDIAARIAFFGCYDYWRKKMNCFEFLILVISLVDIVLARFHVFAVFRVMRPVMRLFRILRLFVRIFERGRSYQALLRHHVSGSRLRYMEDGFDLDLCYATDQIIVMSTPASGYSSLFHNPVEEVAQFVNERHPNKYLIVNATEEQRYPTIHFFGRCIRFPIAQNGVPTVEELFHLCKILNQYLEVDPHHVIAVHSKHGQGRVGIVVAALLIYSHKFDTVSAAIAFLEQCRSDPKGTHSNETTQAIDCASQERVLEYFAIRCKLPEGEPPPVPRKVMLRKITLYGCPDNGSLEISCYAHPGCATEGPDDVQRSAPALGFLGTSEATLNRMVTTSTGSVGIHNTESSQAFGIKSHLSLPHRVIQSKLHQLREECEFDSKTAGAFAMRGTPLFTSAEVEGAPDKRMKFQKVSREGGGNTEAEWTFVDTELAGEIRFEVHRAESAEGVYTRTLARGFDTVAKRSGASRGVTRIKNFVNYISRRQRQNEKPEGKGLASGMLFCSWVHTSFLELNEPPQSSLTHSCDDSLVHVVLCRFDLDKAMNAPTFRNYTSNLKLHLVFQADRGESIQHRSQFALEKVGDEQWLSSISSRTDATSQGYSLEWLNWILRHLWPRLHPALGKLLRESIEPAIQDLLPAPLNNLSFTEFAFTDRIPEFGTIRASARHQEGFELQLDVQLKLDTPVSVMVHAAGLGLIGINHIKLSGLLSVKLKPINPGLPAIEGVQFMFLNMPEMDITFMGNLGGAANLTWVKKVIVDGIQTSLLDIMVMPNLVALNYSAPVMEAGDSIVTFQDVLPHAVLRLRVVSARDITTFSSGAEFLCGKRMPDPFATVTMGDQMIQTAVATSSANPSWGEEFDLLFYDEGQYISVNVKDGGFNNAMLGQVRDYPVTAKRLLEAGVEGLWLSLVGPGGEPQGRICIAATVHDLSDDLDWIRQKMVAQESHAAGKSRGQKKLCLDSLPADLRPQVTALDETPPSALTHDETPGSDHPHAGNSVASPASPNSNEVVASAPSEDTRHAMGRVMDKSTQVVGWCYEATSNTLSSAGSAALAGLSASLTSGRSRRGAHSIAVLICRVIAGNVPKMMPHLVDIRIRVGHAESRLRRCMEATHAEMNNVSSDLHNVIERLALAGWDKQHIADIVERDAELVMRVMRKELGWNLELPHRLCLPISLEDIVALPDATQNLGGQISEPTVEISLLHKSRILGSCIIDLKSVIDPPSGKVYREERSLFKDGVKLDAMLDMELSLYSLKLRNNQRTNAKEQAEEKITSSTRNDESKRGTNEHKKSALKKEHRAAHVEVTERGESTRVVADGSQHTESERVESKESGRHLSFEDDSLEAKPPSKKGVTIMTPRAEQRALDTDSPERGKTLDIGSFSI